MLLACLGPDQSLGVLVDTMERYDATALHGFGAAWYAPDEAPVAYRTVLSAELDPNMEALGRALYADCWLVQAGDGMPPSAPQPLTSDDIACVVEFVPDDWGTLRAALREELEEDTDAALQHADAGSHIFAMLQDQLAADEELDIEDALGELVTSLDELLDGRSATLLMVVTDGEQVWALRHAWGTVCPPLHWTAEAEVFDGSQAVCSEALGAGVWQLLPENQVLVLDRESPPELVSI